MVEHLPNEEAKIAKNKYRSKAKPKDMERTLKIIHFSPYHLFLLHGIMWPAHNLPSQDEP